VIHPFFFVMSVVSLLVLGAGIYVGLLVIRALRKYLRT
jgi:hypothetical protein